jgi:hypothetical protein
MVQLTIINLISYSPANICITNTGGNLNMIQTILAHDKVAEIERSDANILTKTLCIHK